MGFKKQHKEFNCPMCGNPLLESSKALIKCPFCETIIVPKSTKLQRKEQVYDKKKTH